MKRLIIGLMILNLIAITALAQETPPDQTTQPAQKTAQWGYKFVGLEYGWVARSSAALNDTYIQLANEVSFNPKWLNITPGIEINFSDPELSRYFLQEEIKFNEKNSLVLRLNHWEDPDWEIGANYVNLYFQQTLPKIKWAAGASYIAQLLDDWRNPVNLDSDLYQARVLYSVAYVDKFWKDRLDWSIGAENFTLYENYGYDHIGPFFTLGWQVSERTHLTAKVDARIVGIGTATPHLERETYMFLIDWRNLPKKPKTKPE